MNHDYKKGNHFDDKFQSEVVVWLSWFWFRNGDRTIRIGVPCHLVRDGRKFEGVMGNHFGVGLNQLDDLPIRGKYGGKEVFDVHP